MHRQIPRNQTESERNRNAKAKEINDCRPEAWRRHPNAKFNICLCCCDCDPSMTSGLFIRPRVHVVCDDFEQWLQFSPLFSFFLFHFFSVLFLLKINIMHRCCLTVMARGRWWTNRQCVAGQAVNLNGKSIDKLRLKGRVGLHSQTIDDCVVTFPTDRQTLVNANRIRARMKANANDCRTLKMTAVVDSA